MSRLIAISNRVSAGGGSHGGLAVALTAALNSYGGIWFGWSGEVIDSFSGQVNLSRENGLTTATVDLEEQDVEEYYDGYANRTLWPLLHYRVDLAEYERSFADGYHRVNERLAQTVVPLIEPEDLVWIQDFHLIPLGSRLRQAGIENRIGFYLHTPWPPRRLLTTLPEATELVENMFDYDVVGFQTREWLETFCEYAVHEMGARIEDDVLHRAGRAVRLLVCPVGIDADGFAQAACGEAAQAAMARVDASLVGRALIVGVDRLDYSKGLEERFLGYERFLASHQNAWNRVVLLQIAPPSRAGVASYQRIRASLEQQAGRINGAYADLDWVPIRYVNQGYGHDMLAGVYRASRVCLVTPLRDGMNLVAKEYVAAQDPADPGVLILSRFAGAAEQMQGAILVNPYSAEEIADALERALAMPLAERQERWGTMMEQLREQNVFWWLETFHEALSAAPQRDEEPRHPDGIAAE
ncbi:alpha,alpha-trehalose-phosphate synthase [Erythrobacter sp. SG61-1L]|uniref:alpha,alpha-trehalose-phosphate synthase (UDP-forming) n=1 Tax=Erythrobacter sp. SG61-1L TaxID=1603897 RepID=UPI0006C91655|nr:trehalose-6-phosphate synthase [Erythrobacter sp. SG61-1L]KPL67004.1 alpha,alpha-trehalose-phosphate synthase [Erythrobacter sp. SG61-1L]